VKTAGNLVGIVVAGVLELAAGVQLGHDHFGGGDAFFAMNAGRNAAAIVLDRDRAIRVEFDQNEVAMPRQCLVDGVVRHLENHVVQARSVVGIADIHARALANGVKALEHLDLVSAIGILVGEIFGWGVGCFAHVQHIGICEGLRNPQHRSPSTGKSSSILRSGARMRRARQAQKSPQRCGRMGREAAPP
jgi:hypothetical protein